MHSTKVARCKAPEAVVGRRHYCPRSRNNILFIGGVPHLAGWRPVSARPRWNHIQGQWRRHDLSLMRVGEHRFWGPRHHVRIWVAPDGSHAIGQAHLENWGGWPRRHRVISIDAGMESVRQAVRHAARDAAGAATDHVVAIDGTPVLVIQTQGQSDP